MSALVYRLESSLFSCSDIKFGAEKKAPIKITDKIVNILNLPNSNICEIQY